MTDQPTPLATLVAEVDAAVQKMTPGPWRAFVRDIEQMSDGGKGYPLNVYPDCATVHVGHPTVDDERTGNVGLRRQEDIDGIVALVNAWPAVKEGIAQLQRELSMCQSYLELIENRRDPPPDAALDGADPAIVRLELLQCLRAWEPAARVLGNVRACDAERAIVEGQDRVAALEKERDEAQAERNAHARDVMHLEAENDRLRALIDAAGKPWLALDPGVAWEGAIDAAMTAACAEIARLRALVAQQREALQTASDALGFARGLIYNMRRGTAGEALIETGYAALKKDREKARAVLAQEVPGE